MCLTAIRARLALAFGARLLILALGARALTRMISLRDIDGAIGAHALLAAVGWRRGLSSGWPRSKPTCARGPRPSRAASTRSRGC